MTPSAGLLSPGLLSRRLLTLLQLTRMALVFTAIADSQCELLMSWATREQWPPLKVVGLLAIISAGLYGFGMSLNDIIDRRRDAQIAASRPLPSGRIGVVTAHVICIGLVLAAIAAGYKLARLEPRHGWVSLAILIGTGGVICFYDFAGKYLVGPGLVSLGLVRLFHSVIATPGVPVIWHPLWLLTHVTILSLVAYDWEEKRPALTRVHWWGVIGTVIAIDAVALAGKVVATHQRGFTRPVLVALDITPALLLPVGATLAFIALAAYFYKTSPNRRAAGQKLMLFGLLWLIVYDACFAATFGVSPWAGALILILLPLAYLSVQLMRAWSKLLTVSQRPTYVVAGGAAPRRVEEPKH